MWKKAKEHTSFEFVSWIGDIMIAILEAFVAILVYVWDPLCFLSFLNLTPSILNNSIAYLIYFFILLLLTYLGFFFRNYALLLSRGFIKPTDPFIKVKQTGLFKHPICRFHKNASGIEEIDESVDAEFIYIHFINDPESIIVDSLARDLTALVTFKDKNDQKLFPPFFGIWADKPALSRLKPGEQARDLLFTNIPPGELGQKLNIGIHPVGKNHYYAYSQESAKYPLYKNPNLKLRHKEVFVEIDLKGSNVARTVKCKISNSKGKIQITQIKKPNWENCTNKK